MSEKKSKWWLFVQDTDSKLTQIACTDTKGALHLKIMQKIRDDHVPLDRLVRFYGRVVPIETKQVYR